MLGESAGEKGCRCGPGDGMKLEVMERKRKSKMSVNLMLEQPSE